VLRVFDYSPDGIIGEEDTDIYEFCRQVPEDPEQQAWERKSLERAEVHIVGRVTYRGMARYFPTAADHPYVAEARPGPLELVSATAFGNGVAGLVYRRLR